MTKVLVVYYSSYGHIETMSSADCRGRPVGRRRGHDQAGSRAGARRGWRRAHISSSIKLAPDRRSQRAGRLRRDHLRYTDALRQHGRADAQLPRSDRRALDERARLIGKVGSVFVLDRDPAWRPGKHHHCPSTRRCCTRAWWWSACPIRRRVRCALDELTGGSPMVPRPSPPKRRLAAAQRERAGTRPIPGPARGRNRRQAGRR